MTWPGAFAILFAFMGFAMVIHGIPNIRFGGTDHNHYHNSKDEDDE